LAQPKRKRLLRIGQVIKTTGLSSRRIERCIDSRWISSPIQDPKSRHRMFDSEMIKGLNLYKSLLDLPLSLNHNEICGRLIDCVSRQQLEAAASKGEESLLALIVENLSKIRPSSS
jgi:hypothetical protein